MKINAKYSWRDSTCFIPLFGSLWKKKSYSFLPFLDVLVKKYSSKFITSIYSKPTLTGQYIRWNSFSSHKRKINLILTLTHRALIIGSPERLKSEQNQIYSFENGYLEYIINL